MRQEALLLDGLKIARKIEAGIKAQIAVSHFERPPCLVAILSTKQAATLAYVGRKVKSCQEVGMLSQVIELDPKNAQEIVAIIANLNKDPHVDGILLQLPLPESISANRILETIDPTKDVDGFHPINLGKMMIGDDSGFYPCTPFGIKALLEQYQIPISGKRVVIVGRSNIVGKPLAMMLMQNSPDCNATVTVAHSKTENLKRITQEADILVAAIGKPEFITADMVRDGATVIDVGINRVPDASKKSGYRLVGDVAFDAVKQKCFAISPVPGGVGPMTIAMLLQNTLKSYLRRIGK